MNGNYIALNIASGEVRLAEIRQKNGTRVVRGLRHIEIPRTGSVPVHEIIGQALSGEAKATRKALLVLSSEDLSFRDFSFPFASSRKVAEAIRFELSSEYPVEDYSVDSIEILSGEPGKKAFLVAIVKKEMLKERIGVVEALGMRIVGVTCDISSLGNYFTDDEEALVMEMGQKGTLFALYSRRIPLLVRGIPVGIKDLLKKATEVQQEDLKPLRSEIKRTVHSFSARTGLDLRKIHLSGSLLKHAPLIRALNLAGEFEFVDTPPASKEFIVEDPGAGLNLYGSILGAAGLKKRTRRFDFYREEFLGAPDVILSRSSLRWGTLVIVSFLLAWLLSSWLNMVGLGQREKFLAAEIRKVFSASFPQVTRIVDEVKQARSLLEARKTESREGNPLSTVSLLDVLELVSRTIPKELNFQVVNLFWERGRVEIDGRTDSFKTVNSIQEVLSKSRGFPEVTISNAKTRSDGQDVEFKITLRIAG
ncbi:MAG: PilN domain-containing protein [Thermodesulfobacteriota bacterium]